MSEKRFTEEKAKEALDALDEMFRAISPRKQGEFLGHLNDVCLFLEAAGRTAVSLQQAGSAPEKTIELDSPGALLISNERRRQLNELDYTAEHDDGHIYGELAMAAATYAIRHTPMDGLGRTLWPWLPSLPHTPAIPIQDLVRAGAVIATCDLVDCVRITADNAPPEPERSFGDYTPGRYMWHLANIRRLARPIPARGMPGLWNWGPPEQLIFHQ